MNKLLPSCPRCGSSQIVKNVRIHNGKQNHKCRHCGRQFVEDPQQKHVSDEQKALIDRLLLEKLSLAGIARVVNVSEIWLQNYVNQKYKAIPQQVDVRLKKKDRCGLRVMKCGHLWETKEISNGFGLQLTQKLGK